jgi:hypothetical protein
MSDADIIRQIQDEQKPWVEHNFGQRPSWQPLVGIVEEMGELVESISRQERLDAMADIVIFATDYCTSQGWDAGELWGRSHPSHCNSDKLLTAIIGRMCHAHLKSAQGIRTHEDHGANAKKEMIALFSWLQNEWPETALVANSTWNSVKQRDWRANPRTGR